MTTPNDGLGYTGFQGPESNVARLNQIRFQFWALLARVRTCMLVEVKSVTTSDADGPAGFVDILPLVNQVDGAGNAEPHGIIYQCPYFRLQGGNNAVILDPKVGDVGLACFTDRDISSVIAKRVISRTTSPQANPGSARMFSMADGLYVGSFLGDTPTQFVRFSSSGIEITSPVAVTVNAPDVTVNADAATVNAPDTTINGDTAINGDVHVTGGFFVDGDSEMTGSLVTTGEVTASGIPLSTHHHGGVQTGGGNTGGPAA